MQRMRKLSADLNLLLVLIKYKVSLAVALTTLIGYLVCKTQMDFNLILTFTGVFLLAGAASAINQIQERKIDLIMSRTRIRPIPSKKISLKAASLFAAILVITGSFILFFFSGKTALILGCFNIVWYNLGYTNLKKITPFAIVPGSIVGAVPAMIGWSAAGGSITDPRIVFIAFFIFIWQVPHFWLLLYRYAQDYEIAGLPSMTRYFTRSGMKRLIFVWIIATTLSATFFHYFGIIHSKAITIIIVLLNVVLILFFIKNFFLKPNYDYKNGFWLLNFYMFILMFLLILNY